MSKTSFNLLLADDDPDDCFFFMKALEELPYTISLTTVNDGEQLMKLLTTIRGPLPDTLFLDLNMPRKSGFECLSEIKEDEKLKSMPVIIYSTSLDHAVAEILYQKGAHSYIRKPGVFVKVKEVIQKALIIIAQKDLAERSREDFIIKV